MTLKEKAARLFSKARRQRDEKSRHTVQHDRVDEGVLGDWKQRADRIRDLYDEPPVFRKGEGGHEVDVDADMWSDLLDDAFFSYFGYEEPSVKDPSDVKPSRHINRLIAEKRSRSDEMRETRPMTRNQAMESALALVGAANSLRESFQEELGEHANRASDMADHETELDDIDDMLEHLREQGASEDLIREAAQQKRQVIDHLAELQSQQDAKAQEIRGAVQQAVTKAAAAAQEGAEQGAALNAMGVGKQAGMGGSLDPSKALELAERFSRGRLAEIIKLLGRIKPHMNTARRTRRKGGIEEMVDIEVGNDLPLVLPGEMMRLAHPVMKLDFFRRFQEAQLLQYEMWSTEALKLGPVVVCLDESQSMNNVRIVFAKAMALGIVAIANREKRDAAIISFSSEGQVETWFFPKGKAVDPQMVADCGEHFFNGGTSIGGAVAQSLELMRESAPFHKADLAIVTDGEDRWQDDDAALRAELTTLGVKVQGIAIQIAPTDYLLRMCDEVTTVYDLNEAEPGATHLATTI